MKRRIVLHSYRRTFMQTDTKVLMKHTTYFSAHIEKFFRIPHVCDGLCTPSPVFSLPKVSLHLVLWVKLSDISRFSSEEKKGEWSWCCHVCSHVSRFFLEGQ